MWLTDAVYAELARDLTKVVQPRLANPSAAGRERRLFYSVFLPGPERLAKSANKPRGAR
jgi:hypothetical protein